MWLLGPGEAAEKLRGPDAGGGLVPRRVVPLELKLEAYNHGDTVLCAFGFGRRLLLAYRAGLSPASWAHRLGLFGAR